jgi:hypothetical protein
MNMRTDNIANSRSDPHEIAESARSGRRHDSAVMGASASAGVHRNEGCASTPTSRVADETSLGLDNDHEPSAVAVSVTLNIYSHVVPQLQQQALDRLDAWLRPTEVRLGWQDRPSDHCATPL